MTIRTRGNTFIVDVKIAADCNPTGSEVRVRKAAKTKDAALQLEAAIRLEVMRTGRFTGLDANGKPVPGVSAPADNQLGTLKAAWEIAWSHPIEGWARQKSGSIQRGLAKCCLTVLGEETLCREITRDDFDRCAEVFFAEGNTNDTVIRKLQAFSRTLYFAELKKWIRARPSWKRPPPSPPRKFTFSPELEAKVEVFFRDTCGDDDMADMFLLGIDTGCRLGEVLNLEPEDINIEQRWAYLWETKGVGQNSRTVVLYDRALAILKRRMEAQVAEETTGKLFPRWNKKKISRRMQMARAQMGSVDPHFTYHATRHTHLTRLAEQGVEFNAMMAQAGHKSPEMTMRYTHLSPVARREAILRAKGEGTHVPAVQAANDGELHAKAMRAYRALLGTGMEPAEAMEVLAPELRQALALDQSATIGALQLGATADALAN